MPFDESIQDQIVSESNLNSLEKYKFFIDEHGLVRTRSRMDFERSQSLDSFNRLRTSQPYDIFDNKNVYSRNTLRFNELAQGVGFIEYEWQSSSVELTTVGLKVGRALRETRYLSYTPGKSQLIQATGCLCENEGCDIGIVLRSSVSGSVVDTRIEQENWNKNSADDIDFTKANLYSIDFQWLGVGNVRCSILGEQGSLIELHEFKNATKNELPYMRTPSLPIRYEIVSDDEFVYSRIGYFNDSDGIFFEAKKAATDETYLLREICCTGATEAGVKPVGIQYHINTRTNPPSIGTLGSNILAVKLKDIIDLHDNRKIIVFMGSTFFAESENCIFEVFKVNRYVDNGTSWTSISDISAAEFAIGSDIDLTISLDHLVTSSTVTASSTGSNVSSGESTVSPLVELLDESRIIKQNYDSTQSEILLIKAYSLSGTTDVGASITWVEYE